jgi:enoyl-CoA hydratase/carnithine racemase
MLIVEDRGPVRWLTLNRPERKNAIPPSGWVQLSEAFAAFEASNQRVLVVSGAGGAFCSGADLSANESSADLASLAARKIRMGIVGHAALALHTLTKPTIAAVDGVAAGAGMNLAIGCDVVIASEHARFSEIFVRRGLTVDFGGTWLLPRLVGLQRAKEIAMSGRMVGATEAAEIGLALEVVSRDGLVGRVSELAATLDSQAPVGQMFTKQGIDAAFGSSFVEALEREGTGQSICLGSGDAAEGIAAFTQRRDPEFRGR